MRQDERLPWMARTAAEKARARRLVAAGKARIVARDLENYIGRRGLVNYEAWCVEPAAAERCSGEIGSCAT